MRKRSARNFKFNLKYILTELILIVVGILLAINLNTWNSNRKLKNQVQLSIQKIEDEIAMNVEELKEITEGNQNTNDFYVLLNQIADDEIEYITCTQEKAEELRRDFKEQFSFTDSTRLENGEYKYKFEPVFQLDYAEMNDIAWSTAQISNNISEYNYDCLKSILAAYRLQGIYQDVQNQFLDFKIVRDKAVYISTFMLYHELGVGLLERYAKLEAEMKACK